MDVIDGFPINYKNVAEADAKKFTERTGVPMEKAYDPDNGWCIKISGNTVDKDQSCEFPTSSFKEAVFSVARSLREGGADVDVKYLPRDRWMAVSKDGVSGIHLYPDMNGGYHRVSVEPDGFEPF